MEGIVFMKIKYKEAGMEFKCFHNRGHPERWSPKDPPDFNALERVAVLSDEIAECVGIHMTEPQGFRISQEGEDGLQRTEEERLSNH